MVCQNSHTPSRMQKALWLLCTIPKELWNLNNLCICKVLLWTHAAVVPTHQYSMLECCLIKRAIKTNSYSHENARPFGSFSLVPDLPSQKIVLTCNGSNNSLNKSFQCRRFFIAIDKALYSASMDDIARSFWGFLTTWKKNVVTSSTLDYRVLWMHDTPHISKILNKKAVNS